MLGVDPVLVEQSHGGFDVIAVVVGVTVVSGVVSCAASCAVLQDSPVYPNQQRH